MSTDRRLVAAARELLDAGGEKAVTMRAVGSACGLSHNASYKHFRSRKALLAAVAATEFSALTAHLEQVRGSDSNPRTKLQRALDVVIDYSVAHPARYHLLFAADLATVELDDALVRGARTAFDTFRDIVAESRGDDQRFYASDVSLAGILLATLQGLTTQEANGRVNAEKGQLGVRDGMKLLVNLVTVPTCRPGKG